MSEAKTKTAAKAKPPATKARPPAAGAAHPDVREYWEARFATSWEAGGGFDRTRFFTRLACEQLPGWLVGEIQAERLSVVDLGCAAGDGVEVLTKSLDVPVVGVDLSSRAIELAQRRFPEYRFLNVELVALSESFDVAFTSDTLAHFPDPQAALRAMMRRARRYLVALVPFQEAPLADGHVSRFDLGDVPVQLGSFQLVSWRVLDTRGRPGGHWEGRQLLLVYANTRTDKIRSGLVAARQDSVFQPGATLATAGEQVRCLETVIERRWAQGVTARMRALERSLGSALPALSTFRSSKAYRLAQFAGTFRRSPKSAAVTSALWATGYFRRRNVGLIGAMQPVDPVGSVEDVLRECAGGPHGAGLAGDSRPVGGGVLARGFKRLWDHAAGRAARELLPPLASRAVDRALEAALVAEVSYDAQYAFLRRNIASVTSTPVPHLEQRYARELAELRQRAKDAKGVVIYLPTVNWGYLFQRPQQLMRVLGKQGYLCFFCSATPESDGVEGFRQVEPNIYLCSDTRMLLGFERPILWLNWPINGAYLPFFKDPAVVYEFIDELDVFHLYCQQMEVDHEALIRSSDVVVATADRLLERLLPVRSDAVMAPNAVEPDDFPQGPTEPPLELEPALARGKPIVGYYGALAKWFDYDLLNATARAAPDLTFVLIGPDYDGSASKIERRDNVFVLEQRPYQELHQFSRRFDVATIPFQINDITKSTSPVKLFEYMAAGAPIVTTGMDECRKYPSVFIADRAEDYLPLLRKAVGLRGDARYQQQLARDVKANTWARRAESIMAQLAKAEQAGKAEEQ